jgi:hypothetical protein
MPGEFSSFCSEDTDRPELWSVAAQQTFRVSRLSNSEGTMKQVVCVAAIVMTSWACGDGVPTTPASNLQPSEGSAEFAKVSGWVYMNAEGGNPPLVEAFVEATDGRGSYHSTLTNEDGFYELTVRPGTLAIAASKEGFEAKSWQFSLLKDTVLNFGLAAR